MKFRSLFMFLPLYLIVTSCSTTTCTKEQMLKKNEDIEKTASLIESQKNMKTIKVYKFDGSKQCDNLPGASLDDMAKELASVKIISSEKKHDGLMRIQVCGQPTGQCNVYEILEADWSIAEKAGFKRWKGY